MTRDKRVDLQKRQTSRNVFSCHVVGPQGAGKTSFMKGFLGKSLKVSSLKANQATCQYSNFVVNNIQIYGQEKYLMVIFNFSSYMLLLKICYDYLDPRNRHL